MKSGLKQSEVETLESQLTAYFVLFCLILSYFVLFCLILSYSVINRQLRAVKGWLLNAHCAVAFDGFDFCEAQAEGICGVFAR